MASRPARPGPLRNYGDAWFVGFTDRLTVAVWVGYPDNLVSMKTDFNGAPVEGGTFPALIWHDFQLEANGIYDTRTAKRREAEGLPPLDTESSGTSTDATPDETTTGDAENDGKDAGGGTSATTTPSSKPKTPTPAPTPTPTPTPPTPTAAPDPTATTQPPEDGTSGGAPATP